MESSHLVAHMAAFLISHFLEVPPSISATLWLHSGTMLTLDLEVGRSHMKSTSQATSWIK